MFIQWIQYWWTYFLETIGLREVQQHIAVSENYVERVLPPPEDSAE